MIATRHTPRPLAPLHRPAMARRRPGALWLAPLLGALILGSGATAALGLDRQAYQEPEVDPDRSARSELRAIEAEPKVVKEGGKKKAKKKEPPPELPALPHVVHKLAPESSIGKFMHNMNYMRPLYALLVVFIFLVVMRSLYRKRSIMPSRFQTAMEMVVEALDNLVSGILGPEHGRRYLPFLGGLFLYIVALNLFGLVPLMMSPTNFIATTAALAICTFMVTQYTAFSKLGVKGVILHWLGEPKDGVTWVVGVLILLPLHIVEEFIKPLSLALRLFGNIFGEDVLLGSMMTLGIMMFAFLPEANIPVGFPLHLPFMFLAMLTSTIQALVFALLSTIYIMMVLPHADHDEHHFEDSAHAEGDRGDAAIVEAAQETH